MFVDLPPKWIQILGFTLTVLCSGAINGVLVKLGWINSRQVAPIYQGDITLPICCFLLGTGIAMFVVPRIIHHRQKQR